VFLLQLRSDSELLLLVIIVLTFFHILKIPSSFFSAELPVRACRPWCSIASVVCFILCVNGHTVERRLNISRVPVRTINSHLSTTSIFPSIDTRISSIAVIPYSRTAFNIHDTSVPWTGRTRPLGVRTGLHIPCEAWHCRCNCCCC